MSLGANNYAATVEANDSNNNDVPMLSNAVCLKKRKTVGHKRLHGSNDKGQVHISIYLSIYQLI